MKWIKKILMFLLFAFLVIQFIRPAKNNDKTVSTNHITSLYGVNTQTESILTKACYDCHSNNTNYPWYSNVQPVLWWLDDHIRDGKKHLNFSEFGTYRLAKQYHKLEECMEEVKEGQMPLKSYTWVHKDAVLSEVERATLTTWFNGIRDTMKAKYPLDSLVRPKKK